MISGVVVKHDIYGVNILSYKTKQRTKLLLEVCFMVYLIVLFYFLFFSDRYGRTELRQEYQYNLVPFQEIKRFIQYREILGFESFLANILGNIFAFSPFGFMLPILNSRKRGILYVTLVSFEFSLFIELIQLITKVGSYDVDDMIMNTIGGVIGYIIYRICYFIWKRRSGKHGVSQKKG